MAGNKVKYNIKNAHYALQTETAGVIGWAVPVPLPGMVSISLEPTGESNQFYADGIEYWTSSSNGGYEGEAENALVDDDFRQAILKEILDSKKVLFEDANAVSQKFALLFEIDGDVKSNRFCFYNCMCERPKLEGKTTEDKKEPDTDTLPLKCTPMEDGIVRAKTTAETDAAAYDGWFAAVYIKSTVA